MMFAAAVKIGQPAAADDAAAAGDCRVDHDMALELQAAVVGCG